MNPPRPHIAPFDWLLIVLLSVLWGSAYLFIAVAVKEVPVFTVVLARVSIAAAMLLGVMAWLGLRMPRDARSLAALGGMSAINNLIPFSLIVFGQTRLPSGMASVLTATVPIFTVLIAAFTLRDEPITTARLAGVAIGAVGVAVLVGFDPGSLGEGALVGVAAMLAAALSYACAGIFGRRGLAHLSPVVSAAGTLTCSTALMAIMVAIVDQPWRLSVPSAAAIGALLMLAVVSSGIASLVFFRLLQSAGATNSSLVTLLMPVTAILLGVLLLDERLSLRQAAGIALVGLALLVIDGRLLALARGRERPS